MILSGEGAQLCPLDDDLDFGSVSVGQSKNLTFDLMNSGGGTPCGTMTEP